MRRFFIAALVVLPCFLPASWAVAPAPAVAPSLQEVLESPAFLDDLEAFVKQQSAPVAELRRVAESGDLLGRVRWCAVTTHERYKLGLRPIEGIAYCRQLAEQGVPVGMFLYARAYAEGRGVAKNNAEAVRWYRQAAEKGNPFGMDNLGWMYKNGRGVAKDETEAVRWYRQAVEKGDSWAMYALGWMYFEGRGVLQDDVEAVYWHRKAAEQNYAAAQYEIGWMYTQGRGGLPRNVYEAINWFTKAADHGDDQAKKTLARMGVKYPRGDRRDNLESWALGFLGQIAIALLLAYVLFGEFRKEIAEATHEETPEAAPDDSSSSAPDNSLTPPNARMVSTAAPASKEKQLVPMPRPQVPDDILAAGATEQGAKALLFALLLADGDSHTHQLAILIREAGSEVARQADLLAQKMRLLNPHIHVPIINLIMPSLMKSTPVEHDRLLALITELVETRPKTNIEGLVLLLLCKRYLGRDAQVRPAMKYKTMSAAAPHVAALISLFVHMAKSGVDVFNQAMATLGLTGQSLLPMTELNIKSVESVLGELNQLAPLLKPQLVKTCLQVVLTNDHLSLAQEELIRAACAVIDSPLPSALESA